MDIHQQYVLLTGASGGIGEPIAHTLAARGARLILLARDAQNLKHCVNHSPSLSCIGL